MINAQPYLDEARACLQRVRAGEDVTAELSEHLATVTALPYSRERYTVARVLRLALFGSSDHALVEEVVRDRLPVGVGDGPRGLILREGDALGVPMADNPWRIPAEATLDEAITRIWGGVAEDVGRFVTQLRQRLVGLALFEYDPGAPLLAYLFYHERARYEIPEEFADAPRPSFDRRNALAWEPFGDLSAFVGHAPAPEPSAREDVTLPETLRDFYAVHAGMRSGMWWLYAPGDVSPWSDMISGGRPEPVRAQDGQTRLSSELLDFFSYGDDRSDLFDLADDPDDLDDPPVRGWSRLGLDAAPGERFWPWFDGNTSLFLGEADA